MLPVCPGPSRKTSVLVGQASFLIFGTASLMHPCYKGDIDATPSLERMGFSSVCPPVLKYRGQTANRHLSRIV